MSHFIYISFLVQCYWRMWVLICCAYAPLPTQYHKKSSSIIVILHNCESLLSHCARWVSQAVFTHCLFASPWRMRHRFNPRLSLSLTSPNTTVSSLHSRHTSWLACKWSWWAFFVFTFFLVCFKVVGWMAFMSSHICVKLPPPLPNSMMAKRHTFICVFKLNYNAPLGKLLMPI